MTMPDTYYNVSIECVWHTAPGGERRGWDKLADKDVDSLEEAREVINDHIPVALDSGEPTHYDTGDGDVMNVGRIYHFWYETVGRDDPADLWTDAWVNVTRHTKARIPYSEVVPETEQEPS